MKDLAIKVEGLTKAFDSGVVLDNLSLEIRSGERLCIIGRSGCGKTVLAKHFNGLKVPDSGRVLAYGRDIQDLNQEELYTLRRKIGYVFQNNALSSSLDIYSNVSMPLRQDPDPARPEENPELASRVKATLESVGLGEDYFFRMPNKLSGGQRKRVAVARAILTNPPVIIYDEPTTGLDPESAGDISDIILNLSKNGNTTIIITHEKRLMKKIGDRIIFLRHGKIYFDGSYIQLESSEDTVIRKFLGN